MKIQAPANDFRPGYGIAVLVYLLSAVAVLFSGLAFILLLLIPILMFWKTRKTPVNKYLKSHLVTLFFSSVMIVTFSTGGSIFLEKMGIIVASKSGDELVMKINETEFNTWLPVISVTFFIYLGWLSSRLVTGVKLLRNGYAIGRSKFFGAVLKAV